MYYISIRFNEVQCNKYSKTVISYRHIDHYIFNFNFNVIDNILFKLSDIYVRWNIGHYIIYIFACNPYIKTHNLLVKRQPLYNYMIYTSAWISMMGSS